MNIESVKVFEGKLILKAKDREFYLADGVYRRDDGETITISDHRVAAVLTTPDLDSASKEQLENYIADLSQHISTVENDAQLANIDLQKAMQKQSRAMQMMSNASSMEADVTRATVQNIR